MTGENLARGEWCLGHGIQGQAESLRAGHYVEAHLVSANFSPKNTGTKGLGPTRVNPTFQSLCNHCRSIRRWHAHHENAERRARKWRREHADRWVKAGRHLSVEDALTEMDIGGVTEIALTELILSVIDEECPGYCAYEEDRQIIRHRIKRVADLHIDVKDPKDPFAIENIGILCVSCNTAKKDETFATFMYKRRAALQAWRDAISKPSYRRSEQLSIDWTGRLEVK